MSQDKKEYTIKIKPEFNEVSGYLRGMHLEVQSAILRAGDGSEVGSLSMPRNGEPARIGAFMSKEAADHVRALPGVLSVDEWQPPKI